MNPNIIFYIKRYSGILGLSFYPLVTLASHCPAASDFVVVPGKYFGSNWALSDSAKNDWEVFTSERLFFSAFYPAMPSETTLEAIIEKEDSKSPTIQCSYTFPGNEEKLRVVSKGQQHVIFRTLLNKRHWSFWGNAWWDSGGQQRFSGQFKCFATAGEPDACQWNATSDTGIDS